MIGIPRDQHMREQPRTGKAAVDGPRRRGTLHYAVAGIATQLWSHMTDDLRVACLIF